jgi:hypothetical protein
MSRLACPAAPIRKGLRNPYGISKIKKDKALSNYINNQAKDFFTEKLQTITKY